MVLLKLYCRAIFLLLVVLSSSNKTVAQRNPLDYSTLNAWPEIAGEKISNDGKFVIYSITSRDNLSKSEWHVKATDNSWQRQLKNATQVSISSDSKFIVYLQGMDSVVVYNPKADLAEIVLPGNSYQLSLSKDKQILACLNRTTKQVCVYNLKQKIVKTFNSAESFELSDNGEVLVLTSSEAGANRVKWINTDNAIESAIAAGNRFSSFAFDSASLQIAFIEDVGSVQMPVLRLRYFKKGMDTAILKVQPNTKGIDSGYAIQANRPRFNVNGTKIFFSVTRKIKPIEKNNSKADVTIWRYNDVSLPAEQNIQSNAAGSYTAVIQTADTAVIQLNRLGNNPVTGNISELTANNVVISGRYNLFSVDTTAANTPSHYLVNTSNGKSTLLVTQKDNAPILSAGGDFALWYNPVTDGYYSYEIKTSVSRSVSSSLKGLLRPLTANGRLISTVPYGVAAWLPGDTSVLIYDQYDIWKLDMRGVHQPMNITKGYGRSHNVILRIWNENKDYDAPLINESTILLCAFGIENKKNGFFKTNLLQRQEPVELAMDDCLYYAHMRFNNSFLRGYPMYKAANTDTYLLRRTRADQYPELLVTKDFKKYTALTNLEPEANYNWVKAELIKYKLQNSKESSAVLYKPTDFDPAKKYPVIFYIYEKLSYRLHQYIPPAPGDGSLNIAFLVSNGYLICTPDIEYTKGRTGESALQYVTAAVRYVSKLPYVNVNKLGIQGHSFGGYQVNYIVANSNLFAAAQPSAGASDFVSYYNGNYRESSAQFYFEKGQGRMGSTLWENPELFQQNSPVYKANKVTTPVLIMHNKEDGEVPFQQGLEWFTALKRSGKKVWLIQYDKEYHAISQYKNQLDYTMRVKDFFDHYLKDLPAPEWMKP